MQVHTLWRVTIPRIVLGAVFAGAALNYLWSMASGSMLVTVPILPAAMRLELLR
jgi:ABC-type transport system involved in cytochrome c biogenesis permease subunit